MNRKAIAKQKYVLVFLLSCNVNADTFKTPSYEIEVGSCPEGYVTCETIPVKLIEIATGKSSSYTASTLHTLCADGETPCRFLGYQFLAEDKWFYIYDTGSLEIRNNDDKVLMTEEGGWSE